jgi:hypothetical protein
MPEYSLSEPTLAHKLSKCDTLFIGIRRATRTDVQVEVPADTVPELLLLGIASKRIARRRRDPLVVQIKSPPERVGRKAAPLSDQDDEGDTVNFHLP